MRLAFGFAAIVCGLATGLDAGAARQERNTVRHTLRFAGTAERTLTIRTTSGSIRIAGHAGSDVELEARRTIEARTESARRQGEANVTLSLRDQDAHVEAVARDRGTPACGERWEHGWQHQAGYSVRYDFDVRVPSGTRLILCTVNGGDVEVRNTRGDFEIDNVNGRITLADVRGSGSARTVNGEVTATLLELPRGSSEFKTTNGDVTVTWPAGLAARLRMKTFNGGLFTDFPPEPVDVAAAPTVQQRRGERFIYRSDQFTEVQVGRGGADVTLESFNGDVRVLRGSR